MRWNRCLILLFVLLVQYHQAGAAAKHFIDTLPVKPHPNLGLAFPGADPSHYSLLSKIGLGVVRLTVPWSLREPAPGQFYWQPLDARILQLQKLGISPLLTLVSDAPWAVGSESSKVMNRMPNDLAIWRNFVTTLVERYDHDGYQDVPGLQAPLRYYQVANEWVSPYNHDGGWADSNQALTSLFTATYKAVKAADAGARVVLGGIAAANLDLLVLHEKRADYQIVQRYNSNSELRIGPSEVRQPVFVAGVERIYQILQQAPYDLVDAHLYGLVSRNPIRLAALRSQISGRDIVATECGGPSLDYQHDYQPADHFQAVFEWNLSALSEGVEFCLWFGLAEGDGGNFGNQHVPLLRQDGSLKPGYLAYQLLAYVLQDVSRVERLADNRYVVHRHGRSPLFIAWTGRSSPALSVLPAAAGLSGELQLWRVSDAVQGLFSVQTQTAETPLMLNKLPLIASTDLNI